MSFEARYSDQCPACGERIVPGDDVTYSEDNELIHAVSEPVDDPDEPQRNERHCTQCFTVHAGECL
ncbi:hypothetical protein [Mycolicibacterium fortuitum]|uniref:hypothetical protein n=1 Tax=Mycolicibacterium fortuitum TaxID=1766 RepID=UPI00096CB3A8|nr:hypothetical protein [Mycolicibacterium fortuitum]OMC12509.1 hypothetical protein A5734_00815 [Mycolicibacterium fortuitum]